MNKCLRWFIPPLASLSILSCATYDRTFPQAGGPFDNELDYVIQIDDAGKLREPDVATNAVSTIREISKHQNIIVVIFIHGWHHNASPRDKNAKEFADSLVKIRNTLDDRQNGEPGIYRKSREVLTGDVDVKVIGIYVGWRGKSLPMPLDYLTFWGRKSAAERVGNGEIGGFLSELNEIYQNRLKINSGEKAPFMGLVSFGHSFGGQVLLRAVSPQIERELIVATQRNGDSDVPTRRIFGFGTLAVLLNPAVEAKQYEAIDSLSRKLTYDHEQTPVMLTLSSQTDSARIFWFPIARLLRTTFRPSLWGKNKDLDNQALGSYAPQVTHAVETIENGGTLKFDPEKYDKARCEIAKFDLTNIPEIGKIKLAPLDNTGQPYSPFIVASVSGKVIIKHNGIFKDDLRDFLNNYVALTQGKNLVLGYEDASNCQLDN